MIFFVSSRNSEKSIQVVTSSTWSLQVVRARRVMLELRGDQNFLSCTALRNSNHLENIVYHYFRQLWLVSRVKLMEINSNLFSRQSIKFCSLFSRRLQRSSEDSSDHHIHLEPFGFAASKSHRLPSAISTSWRDTVLLRWESLKNRVDVRQKMPLCCCLGTDQRLQHT